MPNYNELVKTMFWEILENDFPDDFIQWMYDSVKQINFAEDTYNEMYTLLTSFFVDIATIVSEHPERESIMSEFSFIDVVKVFSEEEVSEWIIFDTIQEIIVPE